MLFRPQILLNLLLILDDLQRSIKHILRIQQVKRRGFNRNTAPFNSFNIALFHIESMDVRLQHADILHNKSLRLKFENSSDILLYQHIILADSMVLLTVRIRKPLARRPANDYIYFSVLFLNRIIVRSTDISLHFNTGMIKAICILHIRTVLKGYFYIIFLSLHEAEAQASCSCKQVYNFVHGTFLFLPLKLKAL